MAGQRVLVIEDNALNMELVLALLEQTDCIALQATNAETGIELAKSESPQVILMDVSLPGMDGLTAVSVLKGNDATRHIPIIVLTAHAMRGDEAKAIEAGCDGYLTKPIDTQDLLRNVERFITPSNNHVPHAAPAPVAICTAETKRVLIVDDDEVNRDLLEGLLESLGHQAESVTDGHEALARLKTGHALPLPDLVLLDVMMPGINGFEVAQAIRQDPAISDLPIVMVTALSSNKDRLDAVEAGANDFIAKPIDKTELRVRTASLLRMKEAQDAIKQHRTELEDTVHQRTAALQKALLDVNASRQEADKAHLDTIYRLAVASEYKDKDTATHIQRVSNYCALLARHLRLPDEEVEILCVASPMHDVGKIGVPDSILLKPGKLDAGEWAIMQQHTTIGARILRGSSSKLLQAGEIIALSHHEKWDGTGYPHGLIGQDIPLWGRICAVADVFDALTSERPYKKAFTNEQALDVMHEERGRHFDPALLDLFIQIKDEIIAVQQDGG